MAAARPGAPQLLHPGTLLLLLPPLLLVLPGGCRALEGEPSRESARSRGGIGASLDPSSRFWRRRAPGNEGYGVGDGWGRQSVNHFGGGSPRHAFLLLLAPADPHDLFCTEIGPVLAKCWPALVGEPLEMQASHPILEPFFLSLPPPRPNPDCLTEANKLVLWRLE